MGNCTASDENEYGTDAFWAKERDHYLNDANRPYRATSRDAWKDAARKAIVETTKREKRVSNLDKAMDMCRNGYSPWQIEAETGVTVVN